MRGRRTGRVAGVVPGRLQPRHGDSRPVDQGTLKPPARPIRRVALLPWGDVIEDFLAGLGMTLAQFCEEMTGGWLFGYVEALRRAGIETVIVCVSTEVEVVTHLTHRPTGAAISVLPAPRPTAGCGATCATRSPPRPPRRSRICRIRCWRGLSRTSHRISQRRRGSLPAPSGAGTAARSCVRSTSTRASMCACRWARCSDAPCSGCSRAAASRSAGSSG